METAIAGFIIKITAKTVIEIVTTVAVAGIVCWAFFKKDKWADAREEED